MLTNCVWPLSDGCVCEPSVMGVFVTPQRWVCLWLLSDGCVCVPSVMGVFVTPQWWVCLWPLSDGCVCDSSVMGVFVSPQWWVCLWLLSDGCVCDSSVMGVFVTPQLWVCLWLHSDGCVCDSSVIGVFVTPQWSVCLWPLSDGCVCDSSVMGVFVTPQWWVCLWLLSDGCVCDPSVVGVFVTPRWWVCLWLLSDACLQALWPVTVRTLMMVQPPASLSTPSITQVPWRRLTCILSAPRRRWWLQARTLTLSSPSSMRHSTVPPSTHRSSTCHKSRMQTCRRWTAIWRTTWSIRYSRVSTLSAACQASQRQSLGFRVTSWICSTIRTLGQTRSFLQSDTPRTSNCSSSKLS